MKLADGDKDANKDQEDNTENTDYDQKIFAENNVADLRMGL